MGRVGSTHAVLPGGLARQHVVCAGLRLHPCRCHWVWPEWRLWPSGLYHAPHWCDMVGCGALVVTVHAPEVDWLTRWRLVRGCWCVWVGVGAPDCQLCSPCQQQGRLIAGVDAGRALRPTWCRVAVCGAAFGVGAETLLLTVSCPAHWPALLPWACSNRSRRYRGFGVGACP
jgi:hypothetical protein